MPMLSLLRLRTFRKQTTAKNGAMTTTKGSIMTTRNDAAKPPTETLANSLTIEGTKLQIYFTDGWLITLNLAELVDADHEKEDREGPSWYGRDSELNMTCDEAVKLANVLLAFAAALKATVNPEYL